jgi:ABC-type multidrug transport system fused ATPase/permease subunit
MLLNNWYNFIYDRLIKHKESHIKMNKKSRKISLFTYIFNTITLSISILGLGMDINNNNSKLNISFFSIVILSNLCLVILNAINNSYQFNRLSEKHKNSYNNMMDLLTEIQLIKNGHMIDNKKEYIINLKNKLDHIIKNSPIIDANGYLMDNDIVIEIE